MRKRNGLLLAVVMVMLLAMSRAVLAAPVSRPVGATQELMATLKGAEELKGGDTDGTGTSTVKIDTDKNEVCFDITVGQITLPATAAHIHEGALGVAGGVVLPLAAPDANGKAAACVTADAALIGRIVATPANFYVNVHNADFPDGALRGQLAAGAQAATPAATTGPADTATAGATTAPADTATAAPADTATAAATAAPAMTAGTDMTAAPAATAAPVPATVPDTGANDSNIPLLLGLAVVLMLIGLPLTWTMRRRNQG